MENLQPNRAVGFPPPICEKKILASILRDAAEDS